MAVRIRMKKLGRKHRPFYRICAMDSRAPRDGRVLEELGTYDPMIPDVDARAVLNGERIKYWFSFPENAHITIRVFDLSGRFITTLFDGYRTLALDVDRLWDGRTETYKVVPPGTYIMHLETVNRVTGETLHDMAPVVIGTKLK